MRLRLLFLSIVVGVAAGAALMTDAGFVGPAQVRAGPPAPIMALNASGDDVTCNASSEPTLCTVGPGTFQLQVEAITIPSGGYDAFETEVYVGALTWTQRPVCTDEVVWPDEGTVCVRAVGFGGQAIHGAITGSATPPFPQSSYTGDLVELDLDCTSSATVRVSLIAYPDGQIGSKYYTDDGATIVPLAVVGQESIDVDGDTTPETVDVADTLDINCGFVVDSTGDGGDAEPGDGVCDDGLNNCTLRAAIEEANDRVGADVIAFDIGDCPCTIQPDSPLPAIDESVVIDATTDPSFSGTPVIVLDGTNAGASADGLSWTGVAAPTTVRGLVISNFGGYGISIGSGANDIEGNYIGVGPDGVTPAGNGNGFRVNGAGATIGGTTAAARNIISGNDGRGIDIVFAGPTVLGNYIGLGADGSTDVGNGADGIRTVSGGAVISSNVISGNAGEGILLSGENAISNTVQGNYIGLDATATLDRGNTSSGIYILRGDGNTIGGTGAGEGNVISGNDGFAGIALCGNPTSCGGEGSPAPGDASGNVIRGNYIGTDDTGTIDLGNSNHGISLDGTGSGNTIGGTAPGARNVISGNTGPGIEVFNGATGTVIQGNYIGIDADGDSDLGNGSFGVYLNSSSSTTLGGAGSGARNVISGNDYTGVGIAAPLGSVAGTIVLGNYIGTDAAGTSGLGNSIAGIGLGYGASGVTIGGTSAGQGNLIAFNLGAGVGADTISFPPAVSGIAVRGNAIHSNSGIGIDWGTGGVTLNDLGDGDSGDNGLQNFPVITSAEAGNSTAVEGTLNSTASTTFNLDFYSTSVCDASAYGEAELYLGSTSVMTDGSGNATFSVTLEETALIGDVVVATATDPSGNTSEFSLCLAVTLFADEIIGTPGVPGSCPNGFLASNPSCRTDMPSGIHQAGSSDGEEAGMGEAASGTSIALFYADTGNSRIKKLETDGRVYDVAGGGMGCGGQTNNIGDGCSGTQAVLSSPRDVFVRGSFVYIADTGHCLVRRVSLKSPFTITTVAGSYAAGCGSGSNQLNSPRGVYVDTAETYLYVADTLNCRIRRVRLSDSIVTTVAGMTGSCGSPEAGNGDGGLATSAQLNNPHDVHALLPSNDLVIADTGNNKIRLVELASDGTPGNISTIAGTGQTTELDAPEGVAAFDYQVLVADTGNDRVRMIQSLADTIATIETTASFTNPRGVTFGTVGQNLTVTNTGSATVVTVGVDPGSGDRSNGFQPVSGCSIVPGRSAGLDWALPAFLLGAVLFRKRLGRLFVLLRATVQRRRFAPQRA